MKITRRYIAWGGKSEDDNWLYWWNWLPNADLTKYGMFKPDRGVWPDEK